MKKIYAITFAICFSHLAYAQLFIDNFDHSPQELVESIFNGDDVIISNVSFTGDSAQFAYYQSNGSVMPLDSGLVMVTGNAYSILDSNIDTIQGNAGDPDLYLLSPATSNFHDVASIEFDITVFADTLSFFYSFASYEYAGYTCNDFNDQFGLLLSGPGINGQFSNDAINIATIPNTNVPIAINTINSGIPSTSGSADICEEANPDWQLHTMYFIDNSPPVDNFAMNGMTVRFEAKSVVSFGETYHVKMVIGDAFDYLFDSAVFLEAKTVLGYCLDWGSLSGTAFTDENDNGLAEEDEIRFPYKLLQNLNSGTTVFTDQNGDYQYCEAIDQGELLMAEVPLYYSILSNPVSYEFDVEGGSDTANFILTPPEGEIIDLVVNAVTPANPPMPGFEHRVYYNFKNIGLECVTGSEVNISFDPILSFIESDLVGITSNGNELSYGLDEFCSQETITFYVDYLVSDTVALETVLLSTVSISVVNNEVTPENNTYILEEIVIGAYDPNDKLVSEEFISPSFIDEDKKLDYTIRFMNTGTAPAQNVKIRDVLPLSQLDLLTLEIKDASHDGLSIQLNADTLEFLFEGIMLPDSSVDLLGSQGFVTFQMAPYSSMLINESILNQAAIYFDFNEPIITNQVSTTLIEPLSIAENSSDKFVVYPNPNKTGILNISANSDFTELRIFNVLGERISSETFSGKKGKFDVSNLNKGIYFIQIADKRGNSLGTQKFIRQ